MITKLRRRLSRGRRSASKPRIFVSSKPAKLKTQAIAPSRIDSTYCPLAIRQSFTRSSTSRTLLDKQNTRWRFDIEVNPDDPVARGFSLTESLTVPAANLRATDGRI